MYMQVTQYNNSR